MSCSVIHQEKISTGEISNEKGFLMRAVYSQTNRRISFSVHSFLYAERTKYSSQITLKLPTVLVIYMNLITFTVLFFPHSDIISMMSSEGMVLS